MKRKVLLGLLLGMVVVGGCSRSENTVSEKSELFEKEENIKNDIQEFQEQIEESAEKLSNVTIGEYVTPDESYFTCDEVEGGVALTGYTGTETAINVPETLGGMNVVEIRGNAFAEVPVIGVNLPDTVKIVGDDAFFYCTSLVEVKFGENVEQIRSRAFDGCSALTRISLNNSLLSIGELAFGMCVSLEQIQLPQTLENIDGGAFALSGLNTVTIPASVQTIGKGAFQCCSKLSEIIIEEGVGSIADKAFETCETLERVTLPASITEMGIRIFNQCENVTIYAPSGSLAESYASENSIPFKISEN